MMYSLQCFHSKRWKNKHQRGVNVGRHIQHGRTVRGKYYKKATLLREKQLRNSVSARRSAAALQTTGGLPMCVFGSQKYERMQSAPCLHGNCIFLLICLYCSLSFPAIVFHYFYIFIISIFSLLCRLALSACLRDPLSLVS